MTRRPPADASPAEASTAEAAPAEDAGRRVPVGPANRLASGRVRVVALEPASDGRPREALVLRDGKGVIRAYLNRCKHLPIPLDAGTREFLTEDAGHLLCSTHGARYRLEDGYCVDGPCEGERLEPVRIDRERGVVYLIDPGEP